MNKNEKISTKIKIFYITLTIGSMLLYIPVNRLVTGGCSLAISFDNLIPLVPVFVIPYLFGIVFWIFSIIVINLKGNKEYAIRFTVVMITAGILSILIYIIFPTFVVRPEVVGTDIFSSLIKLVYINDNVYNAAPSGHTFYTVICLIGLYKLLSRYRFLLTTISILIILSTLFTKQHNLLDVVTGLLFALGIYFLSNFLLMHKKSRHSAKAI